jgi:hypothetical protein
MFSITVRVQSINAMGGVMGTDMDAYAAGPNRYIMEVTV